MRKFKIPGGVQDSLPNYLKSQKKIEETLLSILSLNGYEQIDSSVLTSYEMYSSGVGAVDASKLFKLSDTDGNLLVLRPDMTMPISRIVATKLDNIYPKRLCYSAKSYNLSAEKYRDREFMQIGAELYGSDSPLADAEVIKIAIESLLKVGLIDFQIDIGQVDVLKGVLKKADLKQSEISEILMLVDKKDIISLANFDKIDSSTFDIINSITSTFGEYSVLEKIEEKLNNSISKKALKNLMEIYNIIIKYGYEKYISIDLGLVNSFSYYSGLVFKGITKHLGTPIMGGGRYDELCSTFDKDIKATGFAIGIKDLTEALQRQGVNFNETECITAIRISNTANSFQTYKNLTEKLVKENIKIFPLYDLTLQEAKEVAKSKNAKLILVEGELVKEVDYE